MSTCAGTRATLRPPLNEASLATPGLRSGEEVRGSGSLTGHVRERQREAICKKKKTWFWGVLGGGMLLGEILLAPKRMAGWCC